MILRGCARGLRVRVERSPGAGFADLSTVEVHDATGARVGGEDGDMSGHREVPRSTSDVVGGVSALGGVARTRSLIETGFSRARIAAAVDRGELRRVRRGWVAVPTADPELVAAARHGVVLSCITQARRDGLWVLREDRRHVAAEPHRGGVAPTTATVHWLRPLVPRPPGALVDPIENVLAAVASCQPFEDAVVVWESALRQGRADRAALERLPLGPAARSVLVAAQDYSDSGLETLFRVRLRWLRVRILTQIWIDGHRVDVLIGERLVVQLDGGHHVDAQRSEDLRHDARLMLLGYHVLRFTYAQVVSDWPQVQDAIMRAVAQGLHRAP